MFFAKNLKHIRKKLGYSQDVLGEKLGVSRTTIANYEGGVSTPDYVTLIKLAKILDVSLDVFLPKDITDEESVSSTAKGNLPKGDAPFKEVFDPVSAYDPAIDKLLSHEKDKTIDALKDNIKNLKTAVDNFRKNEEHFFELITSLQRESEELRNQLHVQSDNAKGKSKKK